MAIRLLALFFFFAAVFAFIKVFVDTPVGVRVAAVAAVIAVLYDIRDSVIWRRVFLLRDMEMLRLLGQYVIWVLVTVAVAVVGFIVSVGSWEGVLVVLALALVAFRRAKVEENICTRLRRLGVEPPQPRFGAKFARSLDRQITTHADRKIHNNTPLSESAKIRTARWLKARAVSPHRDGRRVVSVVLIAVALLLSLWTAVVLAVEGGELVGQGISSVVKTIEGARSSPRKNSTRPQGSQTTPGSLSIQRPSGSAPLPAETSGGASLMDECRTPLLSTGPQWMRAGITALYVGGTGTRAAEAPGTSIAGCPGELHIANTSSGLFAYTLGTNPTSTRPLSIAVDSRRFGPALFLAPAVGPVEALVHRFKIIGGIRRYSVFGGDFYPLQAPGAGTYILIRRETGTDQAAVPYTVVPPAVAQAWVLAMAKSQTFLWPVPRHENGETVYDFDSNSSPSRVLYTFPYRPSNTVEPELSEAEVEAAAGRAG